MSDQRREKLLDIQKREQLKGLLVNKFKLKYGGNATLQSYIDNEVQKFLKNDRLTEDNLKRLDEKISKESELRERKDAILDDRRSERNGRALSQKPGTAASRRGEALETRSNKSVASSRMSVASRQSK